MPVPVVEMEYRTGDRHDGKPVLCDCKTRPQMSDPRREQFLNEMNRVVPWAELVAVIERSIRRAKARGVRR